MCEDPEPHSSEVNNDLMHRLQEKLDASEEKARTTLAITCDQLAERGIEKLRIDYDGYGDSGSVETVTAYAGEKEVQLEDEVQKALCDAGYDLLPVGWEINNGSYGVLVIDIASRQVTREHNWRIEATEYEEETFSL